jgi:CHAT domain-containing protein/Tfp pilus assembly protein PilF
MTILAVALLVLAAPAGVVVEEVQPAFAAHDAGLRPGDVLLSWERAASPPSNPERAQGTLASPFDLSEVEREQASRGPVTLVGLRDGGPLRVQLPPGEWDMTARPAFDAADAAAYEEGRTLAAGNDVERGLSQWRARAAALEQAGDHGTAAWLYYRVARAAAVKQRWPDVDAALDAAKRAADAAGELGPRARVHGSWDVGRPLATGNQRDRALALTTEALATRRAEGSPSLVEARLMGRLGQLAQERNDLAVAEEHQRRALAIREQLAPDSLDVSHALHSLGVVFWIRGDLVDAEHMFRRSLAIRERLTPESVYVANSLNNIGLVTDMRGDHVAGEEHYRRAFEIQDRLEPDGLQQSATLHNLGRVAGHRGDLDGAEEYYRRSLAIKERRAPVSMATANSLTNLGSLSIWRGDLEAAEDFTRRALAIMEKVAPKSLTVASGLGVLAAVARERQDYATAEVHLTRALEIASAIAPDGIEVANHLRDLAELLRRRGDLVRAQEQGQRAWAIVERKAPSGVEAADIRQSLAEIALAAGDLGGAEAGYRQSRDLRRAFAPEGGSVGEAEACRGLAAVARRQGRLDAALESHLCALAALDVRRENLGGTDEVRAGFGARYAGYYRDTIDLLLEMKRPADAFHVLERYRARGLLALLAERDLVFAADVPRELDQERRLANAEYESTLERLASAKPADADKLRAALAGIRRRQAAVRDRIRAASPRLAALHYSEPLDLAAARAALDPGTVLLSYSLGAEHGHVFAVGPGPDDFAAVRLDVPLARLREDVSALRALLERERALGRPQIDAVARRLSDALLRPVRGPLARAERVLIVPDGPLHLLPFAVLGDPLTPGRARFLAEARPVHVAASVTVFAELKKARRGERTAQVIAFGDPDYSAVSGVGADSKAPPSAVRSAVERGLDLRPLPASRAEVEGLGRLYGAQVYVGAQATEEKAKAVGKGASLIHFACHGLADEKSPLDSSLALSLPGGTHAGRENGLLHAWEIFEQVRLDADLVTLSACGTALGKEMSGEGILGLTRAFQYAGARTVLASLWPVADESTSTLMKSFYGYLKQGQSKDRALRAAQLDMIRSGASHPYRWAAFQLVGDWR